MWLKYGHTCAAIYSRRRARPVSRTIERTAAAARELRSTLGPWVALGQQGGTTGTLGTLFAEWNDYREGMARPRPLAENRRKIEKDIRPTLGHKRLDRCSIGAVPKLDQLCCSLILRTDSDGDRAKTGPAPEASRLSHEVEVELDYAIGFAVDIAGHESRMDFLLVESASGAKGEAHTQYDLNDNHQHGDLS